jgi:hypothetical protein
MMYALIGRVEIKAGHEAEAESMVAERGVPMIKGMPGSSGAYWARAVDDDNAQHSFWLFDTEANARSAEQTFLSLRDMPDAPAIFVSVDVCRVIGQVAPGEATAPD